MSSEVEYEVVFYNRFGLHTIPKQKKKFILSIVFSEGEPHAT